MCRFFHKNIASMLPGKGTSKVPKTETHYFAISEKCPYQGKLVKLHLQQSLNIQEYIHKEIVKAHPNHLFLWTTPTVRSSRKYINSLYPGHNFTSMTDEHGEMSCAVSKRPNIKAVLGERKRIPDHRFSPNEDYVKIFQTYFASVDEELVIWEKRASLVPDYPLYIHMIPISTELSLKRLIYETNVQAIKALNAPYTLHSSLHPQFDNHYISADNCNTAAEQSIFGLDSRSHQDMYCQEAVINTVLRLVNNSPDYLDVVEKAGLNSGIEKSIVERELYLPLFTG